MAARPARQLDLPLDFRRDAHLTEERIVLGTALITYTVRRARRRRGSYTLAIDERGLRIGVPHDASQRWIESVLWKHEKWIVSTLAEWEARRPPVPTWTDGADIMLLGSPLRLTFAPGFATPAERDGRLLIDSASADNARHIAQAVTAWLREQAIGCFYARTAHYAPRLGVAAREVRLSNARTRWGSCHPDGKILLSWRLIQMPLKLVDYVVVHELAHLKEMNHSSRFWRTVGALIPDYAARRKEMRDQAHRYLLV